MKDPRIQKLAGEPGRLFRECTAWRKCIVEMIGSERDLIKAIIEEVGKEGGNVFCPTDRQNRTT